MSGSSNTTTTTTPGTGENTNKQKENPDPHKALAKSREELGGKLSVRANELQVILGLPEKDGQVTIAVDMVRNLIIHTSDNQNLSCLLFLICI